MLRLSLILALLMVAPFFFGQKGKDLVMYKLPEERVATFEYNNALRVVNSRWGIDLRLSKGVDTTDVRLNNERSTEALIDRHGEQWKSKLLGAVKMELSEQGKSRLDIQKTEPFKKLVASDIKIELTPKGKRKYQAKVIGKIVLANKQQVYRILQKYIVKPKKEKLKLKFEGERPLDFSYLENGIKAD